MYQSGWVANSACWPKDLALLRRDIPIHLVTVKHQLIKGQVQEQTI